MAEEGLDIPVRLSIGDIRKQLKEIKSEIANTFDPDQIAALSARAGELQDNLARVNEQAAIYASGSKFEQSANALGLVNQQLLSLDFEGAAESALLLQDRINSITPEEVTKQMKGLQDTFSTLGKVSGKAIIGMIKNVGAMAKSFMAFGAQLLMNPIFLFAIVIAAIVAAIALLLNKLGLLKPILDAIGKVFEWIGWVIDQVVQAIKDFLDWIGLTDFAAEESAKKQAEAAEKKADAYDKASKSITASLDHQIKMASIEGKNTTKLEVEKQKAIRKSAELRLEALRARIREHAVSNNLDEEEIKEIQDKIAAQKELYKSANYEIKEINFRDKINKKKEREEDAKEQADEAKANAKENAAKAKEYAANRLAAERQYRDLVISQMQEGQEKELAISAEKYKRLIEDTKANEKLVAAEKKRLVDLYSKEAASNEAAIRQVNAEEEKKAALATAKDLAEIEASKDDKSIEKKRKVIAAQRDIELNEKELTESQKAAIEERYRKSSEELDKAERELKEKAITDELQKTEKLAELAKLKNEGDLQAAIDLLEARKALELNDKELTEEDKALIEERYRQEREELDKKSAERRKQIEAEVIKATEEGFNLLTGLMSSVSGTRMDELERALKAEDNANKIRKENGEAEQSTARAAYEKTAKKQFEINKKVQIAQAVIQGVQATLAAYSSGLAIPVVGVAVAPVFAALAAATAISNINRIKSQTYESSGGGGGNTGGGAPSASSAAGSNAPNFTLTGGANQGNNAKSSEPVEKTINVTLENKISEAEITGTQQKVIKYEDAATLSNG